MERRGAGRPERSWSCDSTSDVDDIIKFVPAMIEELADAQRRLVAMHDQIRLLVWLGKEEN